MKSFLTITLVSVFMGVMASQSQALQPATEVVRNLVQAYLLEQIGRDATLIEFNFEGATWTDTALGCPTADDTPTPATIDGYSWSFLMDDGIRYILHSDQSGAQIRLCPTESENTSPYSVYQNPLFSVQHPNLWTAVVVSESIYYFAWRGRSACTQPSLEIIAVGEQSDTASLLDTVLSNRGLSADGLLPFGDTGQSTTVTVNDCNERLRIQRFTALTVNGSGYVLIQTALSEVYPVWQPTFDFMRESFQAMGDVASTTDTIGITPTPSPTIIQPTVSSITAPNAPANASTPEPPAPTATATLPPTVPTAPEAAAIDITQLPFAHIFVGDLFIGRLNNLPGQAYTFDQAAGRQHLVASSDGQQLAFVQQGILYTINAVNPISPNALTDPDTLLAGVPPAWSPEGASLAYVVAGSEPNSMTIQTIASDASVQTYEDLPFITELDTCQAPSSDYVVDRLYAAETGINGNAILFAWLPNNQFLYSATCDGFGLTLYDATNDTLTEFPPDLKHVALAPNLQQIAALRGEDLVIFDLVTGTEQTIPTNLSPNQIGWDITSTQLYYSHHVPNEVLIWSDDATEDEARRVLGAFPFESRLSGLSIYQVDIQNQIEVLLWEGVGFAIGQLIGLPDGSGLLFTLIPSDRSLLTNFANQADPALTQNSTPETELYALTIDFNNPEQQINAQLIAFTSQPVFALPR